MHRGCVGNGLDYENTDMLLLQWKELKKQNRRRAKRECEQRRRAAGKVPPKGARNREQKDRDNLVDRERRMKQKAERLARFLQNRKGEDLDAVAMAWLKEKGIRA